MHLFLQVCFFSGVSRSHESRFLVRFLAFKCVSIFALYLAYVLACGFWKQVYQAPFISTEVSFLSTVLCPKRSVDCAQVCFQVMGLLCAVFCHMSNIWAVLAWSCSSFLFFRGLVVNLMRSFFGLIYLLCFIWKFLFEKHVCVRVLCCRTYCLVFWLVVWLLLFCLSLGGGCFRSL